MIESVEISKPLISRALLATMMEQERSEFYDEKLIEFTKEVDGTLVCANSEEARLAEKDHSIKAVPYQNPYFQYGSRASFVWSRKALINAAVVFQDTESSLHIQKTENQRLQAKIQSNAMTISELKKEVARIKRTYKSFPFMKGYKLITKKDNLKDLLNRFYLLTMEIDESQLEETIERLCRGVTECAEQ